VQRLAIIMEAAGEPLVRYTEETYNGRLESGCNSETAGVISSSAAPQSPAHFTNPVAVTFDHRHVGVVEQAVQ
jgi:hypothetical protein